MCSECSLYGKRHSGLRQPRILKVIPLVFLTSIFCSAAIATRPDDPSQSTHIQAARDAFRKGQLQLSSKHSDVAIEDFSLALQIEPTYMDVFSGLVQAYLASGDKVGAAATLTRLLEIEPDRPAERVKLGQLLLEQNQSQRALAQFSYAIKVQPKDADSLYGFAKAAKQAGMIDRAAEAWEAGKREHPQDQRFKGEQP